MSHIIWREKSKIIQSFKIYISVCCGSLAGISDHFMYFSRISQVDTPDVMQVKIAMVEMSHLRERIRKQTTHFLLMFGYTTCCNACWYHWNF